MNVFLVKMNICIYLINLHDIMGYVIIYFKHLHHEILSEATTRIIIYNLVYASNLLYPHILLAM